MKQSTHRHRGSCIHGIQTNARLSSRSGRLSAAVALLGAVVTGLLMSASPTQAQSVSNIFVIAMENHNFTQPNPTSNPEQIFGNPAAPFINSLITPGNSNATQVSFATAYFNAGVGVHPSEPNYVWAEAGTDFGVHTDADPRDANHNTFYDQAIHLTAQLNAAGVTWRNYQEDVQLSLSPTNSASGTNAPTPNPYYGTRQYNYAVKHNPMAFFADTAVQNVYPLAQFFLDLSNNATARYTWITPNQFNDAHSALTGGFTYQGVHYTNDQASVAQGDNFLSQVIPQIMASQAYQNNGVIIIWWDETENGDGTNRAIPEIIISPLAKGNAYASAVPMNHSSDIKTIEEILTLPSLNNPIPVAETNAEGGYNNVAVVNDLSDLFAPGAIPAPASVSVTGGPFATNPHTHTAVQLVRITNNGTSPIPVPLTLALDDLSANATLLNADGTTAVLAPVGSPFVDVQVDDGVLPPGETATALLRFSNPSGEPIDYTARVLDVVPAP